jgi:protease-4
VQELSEAVSAFRKSGKPTVAFAETVGGLMPANGSYTLATAFEDVRLQPSGDVGLVGLAIEHPFIKGTLDTLGIQPAFGVRENYKNAPNLFTERGFTPDHREATQSLLTDQFDQMISAISRQRAVSEEQVRSWIDGGPYSAQSALGIGLVDELSYVDEAYADLLKKTCQAKKVNFTEYVGAMEEGDGTRVALIYASGPIGGGKSKYDPISESQSVGSDTVTDAFLAATEDPDVKAILFRVDSPGGSYVASDAIWHGTRLAQAKGIPVVVSMGSAAASGGYLISTHADRIVALPGTITGSIGVYSGKFVTRDFWSKLGVSWDGIYLGKRAGLVSSLSDFSPDGRKLFEDQLDRVYDAFVGQVSDGRALNRERALEIAKGRVWTGQQAKARGLVDRLGGFKAALGEVRDLLDLSETHEIVLAVYPKPKDLAERILGGDWENLRVGSGIASSPSLRAVGSVIRSIDQIHESSGGILTWAPWVDHIQH